MNKVVQTDCSIQVGGVINVNIRVNTNHNRAELQHQSLYNGGQLNIKQTWRSTDRSRSVAYIVRTMKDSPLTANAQFFECLQLW